MPGAKPPERKLLQNMEVICSSSDFASFPVFHQAEIYLALVPYGAFHVAVQLLQRGLPTRLSIRFTENLKPQQGPLL